MSVDKKITMNSKETILDLKKKVSEEHNLALEAIEFFLPFENKKKLENKRNISLT